MVECERELCAASVARKDVDKHATVCAYYTCAFREVDDCPFVGDAASLKTHAKYCAGIHALLAEQESDVEKECADARRYKIDIARLQARIATLESELADARFVPRSISSTQQAEIGRIKLSPSDSAEEEEELDEEPAMDGYDEDDDNVIEDDAGLTDEAMVDTVTDESDAGDGTDDEDDETLKTVTSHFERTRSRFDSSTQEPSTSQISATQRSPPTASSSPPAPVPPRTSVRLPTLPGPFHLTGSMPTARSPFEVKPRPFTLTGNNPLKTRREMTEPLLEAKRRRTTPSRPPQPIESSDDSERSPQRAWETSGGSQPVWGGRYPRDFMSDEED